jgi:hypothetical protein
LFTAQPALFHAYIIFTVTGIGWCNFNWYADAEL